MSEKPKDERKLVSGEVVLDHESSLESPDNVSRQVGDEEQAVVWGESDPAVAIFVDCRSWFENCRGEATNSRRSA